MKTAAARTRKVPVTVYLDPEQIENLKAVSGKTGIAVTEIVRQGIDIVLDERWAFADVQERADLRVVEGAA